MVLRRLRIDGAKGLPNHFPREFAKCEGCGASVVDKELPFIEALAPKVIAHSCVGKDGIHDISPDSVQLGAQAAACLHSFSKPCSRRVRAPNSMASKSSPERSAISRSEWPPS